MHLTRYRFDGSVDGCELDTCLEPNDATFHQVVVSPLHQQTNKHRDGFGNARQHFDIRGPFHTLEVQAVSTAPVGRFRAPNDTLGERLIEPSPRVPLLPACVAYAHEACVGSSLRKRLMSLLRHLARDFVFAAEATDVDSSLEHFVAQRRGVCQDFAHFTIGCLRSAGVAAAYVSGYRGAIVSSGHSHAWVAARDEDGHWLQLDPTAATLEPKDYVTLAVGRDYDDVPPVHGTIGFHGTCRTHTNVRLTHAD